MLFNRLPADQQFFGVATADAMSPALLQHLTDVASGFDPAVVGHIMLEIFLEIVGGCSAAGFETAQHFFDWVAGEVVRQGRGKRLNGSPRKAMSEWFPATDPLTIARDPDTRSLASMFVLVGAHRGWRREHLPGAAASRKTSEHGRRRKWDSLPPRREPTKAAAQQGFPQSPVSFATTAVYHPLDRFSRQLQPISRRLGLRPRPRAAGPSFRR